jgi:5-formyltetrahydrofolate cyclo-ligase
MLSRRDRMPPAERGIASARIAEEANRLLSGQKVVGLYAPKGSEVDTREIEVYARAHGIRVAYPRIVDGERLLAFHEVALDQLGPARFGLREPRRDAPLVALADITVFVVPGLAFDRDGGRIGWGRGYYDATLGTAAGATRIGLAFECQLVDAIARDPHDVPLHFIVTEVATYRMPR